MTCGAGGGTHTDRYTMWVSQLVYPRARGSVSSNVVKLKTETYQRVKRMASEQRSTMQDIISRGIDALERAEFARGLQEDFAALRADRAAWEREQAERELWESTLEDGLDL